MFRVAYLLIKEWGILGVVLVNFGVTVGFGWKLFTNHFAHLTKDLGEIKKDLEEINYRQDETIKGVGLLAERISKIEGKIEK